MTANSDDRLIVPGSTILILLLTLVVVIPVATLRMSRGLASPLAEVITLVKSEDHFRGRWKIGELEYLVGQDQNASNGSEIVTLAVRNTGQTEPIASSTMERNGVIDSVLFLDPDGDRYSSVIVAIRQPDENKALQILLYDFKRAGDPDSGQWSDLSKIPAHLAIGYLGHDTLERQSEMLVRTFPLYKEEGDSPTATDQTRSLIWDFRDTRWRPDPRG